MMSKYCPDAREGYREKAKTSLQYIKAHSNTDEWNEFYAKEFAKTFDNIIYRE